MAWRRRQSESQQRGFTLVELLIVIVVIAILAAISVVAYQGVASNAQAAALKASLAQAANKLEMYKVDNGGYPPDQATLTSLLNFDTSANLTYAANNSANPQTYCLSAALDSQQFSVGSANNTPGANACVVNLMKDPSATTSSSFVFAGAPGVISIETSGGYVGTTFVRKTMSASGSGGIFFRNSQVAVGSAYTASGYVRSSKSVSIQARLEWLNSSGSAFAWSNGGYSVIGSSWTRLSATGTAPSGTASVAVSFYVPGASDWSTGDYEDLDAVMLTQGSTLYNYADGNSPGWGWTGTPNASTSIGPPL